jgi:hypothetical protein
MEISPFYKKNTLDKSKGKKELMLFLLEQQNGTAEFSLFTIPL